MPTAPVDDKGTVLYYEDSGAPKLSQPDLEVTPSEEQEYQTLFLLHGTMFHSGIFKRMIPYAAKHNIRIVTINQRGYPGSSPYTESEVDALRSGDVRRQAEVVCRLGCEIGIFVAWFVETYRIPVMKSIGQGFRAEGGDDGDGDGDEMRVGGGAALVAWSAGNIFLFSLLSNLGMLDEKTRQVLGDYLRSVVIYDPATYVMGRIPLIIQRESRDPSSSLYAPMADPTYTPSQRAAAFPGWVSTYYAPPISALPMLTPEEVERGEFDVETTMKPFLERGPSVEKVPTTEDMSKEELEGAVDGEYWDKAFSMAVRRVDSAVFRENVKGTFRVPVDDKGEEMLPELKVVLVWCDESVSECILGATLLANEFGGHAASRSVDSGEGKRQGRARKLMVEKVEGNHFAHWDDAEKTLALFAQRV